MWTKQEREVIEAVWVLRKNLMMMDYGDKITFQDFINQALDMIPKDTRISPKIGMLTALVYSEIFVKYDSKMDDYIISCYNIGWYFDGRVEEYYKHILKQWKAKRPIFMKARFEDSKRYKKVLIFHRRVVNVDSLEKDEL